MVQEYCKKSNCLIGRLKVVALNLICDLNHLLYFFRKLKRRGKLHSPFRDSTSRLATSSSLIFEPNRDTTEPDLPALPFVMYAGAINLLSLSQNLNPRVEIEIVNSINIDEVGECVLSNESSKHRRKVRILPKFSTRLSSQVFANRDSTHLGWDVTGGQDQLSSLPLDATSTDDRPVVFVVLMYNVVGGVERNTIEVMKYLKDKYRFIVITLVPLESSRGSLHHQMVGVIDDYYEIGEFLPESQMLYALEILKNKFRPTSLWLCNGSRWWALNSKSIRNIFRQSRIIDQQVYDTKEGWIWSFKIRHTLKSEIYIAINSKIEACFKNKFRIPHERIKLIYPTFDGSRFSVLSIAEKNKFKVDIGIETSKKIFVFAGRMSQQKRPEFFLDFVEAYNQKKADAIFIMIGQGEMDSFVDSRLTSGNLTNIIRIRQTDSMNLWLGIADGLVITSSFEGLPIVCLESSSVGVPIFSTNVGDVDVLLSMTKSGLTVPVEISVDSFCQTFINDFCGNLAKLKQLAMDSSELVKRRFCIDTISAQYEEIFRKS